MLIDPSIQLDFSDVLIMPKRSPLNSRSEVTVERTFKCGDRTFKCIPIMAANMGTIGVPKVAIQLAKNGFMCSLEKHIPLIEIQDLQLKLIQMDHGEFDEFRLVFPSIGVNSLLSIADIKRLHDSYSVNGIVIDIANGYIPKLLDKVKEVKDAVPDLFIVAGNVVTADAVYDLARSGANCIKVGIGSGSACTTRLQTGVGRPQLSAVIECADAAHQVGSYIMSDGGIVYTSDILKAFGANSDFVMCGSMFAGCEEAKGKVVYVNGSKYKEYYGMSSKLAQDRHFGGMKDYRTSEGREKLIPYTGPIQMTIDAILGGIRSAMTYIGATKLKDVPKHVTFYRVNNQLNVSLNNCPDIKGV